MLYMNLVANWYKLKYHLINIAGQLFFFFFLVSSLKFSPCT